MTDFLFGESDNREFERIRQSEEVRNERLISRVLIVVFSLIFLINLMSRFYPIFPYRAPAAILVLAISGILIRVGLLMYLQIGPRYWPLRKYAISAIDLIGFSMASLVFSAQYVVLPTLVRMLAICVFALLIVVSGLRYSTRVVIFTGALAILLHIAMVVVTIAGEERVAFIAPGVVILSAITFCMAYSASSLLRIHQEAMVKDHLSRFLPAELVEHIARRPELLSRQTERRVATVLFADIRGFTRLSETLPPEQVVEFLNEFLDAMTIALLNQKGMLDKYIGDSVMGVFGVPFVTEDHAVRALRAALDMRERLRTLNDSLLRKGLPELSVGIGLHTGELLIGAIGSKQRLDYTVIGDTVNVASRIEGMTRHYPVEILVSDSTRAAIRGALPLYEVATVHVKNRAGPLTLWSPDPVAE